MKFIKKENETSKEKSVIFGNDPIKKNNCRRGGKNSKKWEQFQLKRKKNKKEEEISNTSKYKSKNVWNAMSKTETNHQMKM